MDWETYEQITRNVYEALGKQSGVKIEGHGISCKVMGQSGVSHQVDVLTSHSDGIHTYKTAIECKYWNKTVNKDIVMKVEAIVSDALLQKGVIVSKLGFTDDAVAYAQYRSIGLVELREATEGDLKDVPRIISHKSWVRRPEILSIAVIPSLFSQRKIDGTYIKPDNLSIVKHDGSKMDLTDVYKEFQSLLKEGQLDQEIEKKFLFPMSKMIDKKENKIFEIDGIVLRGKLIEFDSGLTFFPIDEVWLILKSIFENKAYTISRRGIIKEKT